MKELPVPIPAMKKSGRKTENNDLAMIDIDIYCAPCCLKRAQMFIVLMKDI